MSLHTVTVGGTIQAGDVNQFTNVLQEPSGGTQAGKYWLAGASYVKNALISQYIESLSRGATPVSVSIDTADNAPSHMGSPSTDNLTGNGFQVFAFSTGVFTSCNAAGNFTINF